jgi:hypothetical protein
MDRTACRNLLVLLVNEAAGDDEINGSISVSVSAEFDDGFTVGPNLRTITMIDGIVDLTEVYTCQHDLSRALQQLCFNKAQVSWLDLLGLVLRAPKDMWFAKQMLWWLGSIVDSMTMLLTSAAKLSDMTRHIGTRCLMRYWLAIRRSFEQSQFLSLSVDCGRVGKKNFWVGMVATPENVAAVLPPMEPLDFCLWWVFRWFRENLKKYTFQKHFSENVSKHGWRSFVCFGGTHDSETFLRKCF